MKMEVTDPNMMAEIVRAQLWPNVEERYSFPSVPAGAREYLREDCEFFLKLNLPGRETYWELECSHVGFITMVGDILVQVFCAWDGDGTMYMSLHGGLKSSQKALLVNTDCKHAYGWEIVQGGNNA